MMMKNKFQTFIPAILILIAGCSQPSEKSTGIEDFAWLEGNWSDSLNSFYESWGKAQNGFISGYGYQLKGGDTVFGEKLRIEKIGRDWNYIVIFGEEKTAFKLVSLPGDSLVFENNGNEFPKRITYQNMHNGRFSAIIMNPGEPEKTVHFDFKAQK